MLRLKRDCLTERIPPLRCRLPRQTEHQVKVQVFKSGVPRLSDRLPDLRRRMDAPDARQQPVVHALNTQRQPVYARRAVCLQILRVQRSRVALHRDFRIRRKVKACSQRVHHLPNLSAGHQRRRSSAEKHRVHLSHAEKSRLRAHLAADGIRIRIPPIQPSGERRKIAIRTLFDAHRNMDINRNGFHLILP